jgi:hypothetical protein
VTGVRSAAIASASLLFACATTSAPSATPHGGPTTAAESPAQASDGGATPSGSDPLPSLDALAARATSLAPGLREAARGELRAGDAGPFVVVRDVTTDTCVRVAFAASPEVHVSLVDARTHDALADSSSAGDVALGAGGPVCVRRGGGVELRVEGGGAWRARFIAWRSGS